MRAKWLTRKRVLIALGVSAAALLFYSWVRPDPIEVESGAVSYGPLQVTIDADGRTRALDRYVISAPVTGLLRRITVREGESIVTRAIVAEIEPSPLDAPGLVQLQAQLSAAQARARTAQTALTLASAERLQATRELERRRTLAAAGAISEEQLEQFEIAARTRQQQFEDAAEEVTSAAAEVRAARAALLATTPDAPGAHIHVRAPAPGKVLRIPERSERVVRAGEPLLELGDAAALEAVVDVLSTDAVRIQPGLRAVITGWGGDPLIATVRHIEPAAFTRISALGVEEQRVNVLLDFQHCPESLGDGFRLEASIIVWAADRILVAPAAAFFRGRNGWETFVIEQGRARLRPVQLGEQSAAEIQVLGGLTAGDQVILFPGDKIVEGTRVRSGRN